MTTVSNLVDLVALETGIPFSKLQRLARELINAGFLPKASGRAVPATTMYQRANLILALAISDAPDIEKLGAVAKWEDANPSGSAIDRINAGTSTGAHKIPLTDYVAAQLTLLAKLDHDAWSRWSAPGMKMVFDWTFDFLRIENMLVAIDDGNTVLASPAPYNPIFSAPFSKYQDSGLGMLRQSVVNPSLLFAVACGVRATDAKNLASMEGGWNGVILEATANNSGGE